MTARAPVPGVLLALLALLPGCRDADVVDACVDDAALCPACTSDAECVFTGNACTETVYCAHQDAEIAVIQIGCSAALEYDWPDAAACACVDAVCRSVE